MIILFSLIIVLLAAISIALIIENKHPTILWMTSVVILTIIFVSFGTLFLHEIFYHIVIVP